MFNTKKHFDLFKYRWYAIPVFVLILIIAGMVVQYIPDKPIRNNIQQTCDISRLSELKFPKDSRARDWYTDLVMLMIADTSPSDTGYKKFITSPIKTLSPTPDWANIFPDASLCKLELKRHTVSYARYWHGYQIFLRPLLYFINYYQILTLNFYFEIALFLIILYLMYKKKAYGLILGYVFYYTLLSPVATGQNITYSAMYCISTLSGIIILRLKNQIDDRLTFSVYFTMLGILTSYIDFLTYPIAPLSVSLTILYYVYPSQNAKQGYSSLITYSVLYALGWGLMWSLKWLIATWMMDENIFKDAYHAMLTRLTHHSPYYQINIWGGITYTFKEAFKIKQLNYLIILTIGLLLTPLLLCLKATLRFIKQHHYQIICLSAAIFNTIIYCLILAGHAVRHVNFTYRLWSTALLGLIALLVFLLQNIRSSQKTNYLDS